jgi:iron complex transport system substrate-binding protein
LETVTDVMLSSTSVNPKPLMQISERSQTNIDSSAASGAIDAEVQACVATGQALYAIDQSLLESLAPDLIITQAQCDVCAIRYEDVLDAVAKSSSLKDTQIITLNPQSLGEILEDCLRVGQAAGCGREAEEFVFGLRGRIDSVRHKTEQISPADRTRIAMIEWIDPPMLAANWTPELVELAGGVCPLTTAGSHSTYTNWSELIAFDPEVIVVTPCGFDLPRTLIEAKQLTTFDGWQGLTAVRTDRVYAVDGDAYFNRAGPRIVDSLEILAHIIQPEIFGPPASMPQGRAWTKLVL